MTSSDFILKFSNNFPSIESLLLSKYFREAGDKLQLGDFESFKNSWLEGILGEHKDGIVWLLIQMGDFPKIIKRILEPIREGQKFKLTQDVILKEHKVPEGTEVVVIDVIKDLYIVNAQSHYEFLVSEDLLE